MDPFFSGLPAQTALDLAGLSKQMYDLREARKGLLAQAGCADADALRAAVRDGALPEHPGYESWLSVVLLEREEARLHAAIDWRCRHPGAGADQDAAGPCAALLERLVLPARLSALPPQLHPDGIGLHGEDGLEALVRIVSPQDWSFEWSDGRTHWRLDTAPVAHPGIDGAHLHRPDGSIVASPLANATDEDETAIVQRFLDALARAPAW